MPGARTHLRRLVATALACAVALPATVLSGASAPAAASDAATADEPLWVPWSSVLPGWTEEFVPTSENDCVAGRPACVGVTLRQLGRVFEDTARTCSHHAVFSLAYLRITQTYGWSREIPDYYEDVAFANHQDAVFARYYTDAWTAWRDGRRAEVPSAWLTAFDAAEERRLSATGDLLMGMNAHINRDLPFVVAAVGLVAPDGSSRKRDYDQVEHFLNLATEPMLAEAAQRLDPRLDDANDPFGIGYLALFQMISLWRENAWRNAERLVTAPTPADRARVAASIEAAADATARGILLSQSYAPPLTTSSERDRWCAAHVDDAAPLAYPFGTPTPWGPYRR